MKFRKNERGWVLLDFLAGLSVLILLATVLAIAARTRQKTAARLADTRAAARLAEAAAMQLQSGEAGDAQSVKITANRGERELAIAGFKWVTVSAKQGRESVELQSLVPTETAVR